MRNTITSESRLLNFSAFFWCKQCHEDIRDVTLIKKCKCKNCEFAVALFRRSTKHSTARDYSGFDALFNQND
ncbi:hypothetical protein ANCDUO_26402, partial [Ancylostoma duodenale]